MTSTLPKMSQPPSVPQPETCKIVILEVSGHFLALPATAVLKVTQASSLNSPVQGSEVTLWGDRPLMLLDLHQLLAQIKISPFATKKNRTTHSGKLLVIARTQAADLCAIPVDTTPILLDLPLSAIQMLPPRYRPVIGGIANHIAVLPNAGSKLLVLLLNLHEGLNYAAATRQCLSV